MPIDEFLAANRRNWDERVAIHRRDRAGFYAMDRFLAGEKELQAIGSGELGDVAGKRLIHLQCHFGIDTLILARHGARVTGLDFSPAAIAEAKALATEAGWRPVVCADIYDTRNVTGDFDIVYTTWGTICWLPDIPRWARDRGTGARRVSLAADAHPNMLILERWSACMVPIDTPPDAPSCSTRRRPTLAINAITRPALSMDHSLSRIVGGAARADLTRISARASDLTVAVSDVRAGG